MAAEAVVSPPRRVKVLYDSPKQDAPVEVDMTLAKTSDRGRLVSIENTEYGRRHLTVELDTGDVYSVYPENSTTRRYLGFLLWAGAA